MVRARHCHGSRAASFTSVSLDTPARQLVVFVSLITLISPSVFHLSQHKHNKEELIYPLGGSNRILTVGYELIESDHPL
eukprot:1895454-Pyramimonas_sp.AAC.1